jgi:transcriptional regulator of NAD metabolism
MSKQMTIPGTSDPVPADVQTAAEKYLESKRQIAKHREKMNRSLDSLITAMRAADITEILIGDGEKRLILRRTS